MSGTLSGPKGKANCVVSATRVTLQGTRLCKDCMFVITWVSSPLPMGDYRLKVEGKTMDMCQSPSGWSIIQTKA